MDLARLWPGYSEFQPCIGIWCLFCQPI